MMNPLTKLIAAKPGENKTKDAMQIRVFPERENVIKLLQSRGS